MSRRDSVTALGLFVLALGYFSLSATHTLDLRDEGYLLGRAADVAAGAVPHRDFVDVYGPGVFLVTGAALRLGGGEVVAVRILLMLAKALAVAMGFAISRRVAPWWVACVSSLAAIAWWGRLSANLNTPYAALFTIPIALTALFLLMRALERRSTRACLVAGAVAGLAILFKQSLGSMLAYAMVLAVWAVEAHAPGVPDASGVRDRRRGLLLAIWPLAAIAPLVPVISYLSLRDWLVHFVPFQALVLLVAASAWRRGGGVPSRAGQRRAVAFLAGVAALPALTFAVYLGLGAAPALVDDTLALPMRIRGYYVPASLPPPGLVVSLLGGVSILTALFFWLDRRPRPAAGAGAAGLVALLLGRFGLASDYPRLYEPEILLGRAPFALEGVLLPGLMLAALLLVGRSILRPEPDERDHLRSLLPLLFFQALLCFEVFPRAGQSLWILHGALAPLLAVVLAQWSAGVASQPVARPRRAFVATGILLLPLWLVAPIVRAVVFPADSDHRALALPHLRGIEIGRQQIAAEHLSELEALVAWLAGSDRKTARLLLLTNEPMIPFLSGQREVFEEQDFSLFLAAWGMLRPVEQRALDSKAMVDRLRNDPEVLVIHRPDPTAQNLRRALPRIRGYVERHFELVEHFGPYRVLRHRAAGERS